jgi:sodium/proline symporter
LDFIFFLFIFVLIGALSVIYNKHNNIDYLVANYDIKSWLVALSAVATSTNSGYMFIGMIGYSYLFAFLQYGY